MHKIILLFIITIGLLSCKPSQKGINNLEIAKKYYEFLNSSDNSGMLTILGDSLVIRESEDDYEEEFSQEKYSSWLKWDSVFNPTYQIISIEKENHIVKAKISKIDDRISFLHEVPMVWEEIVQFDYNNKIVKIERVKYEVFDVSLFLKNRDALVNWIQENHPQLNGFINDQTEKGGKMYLKAMGLFEKRNNE